MKSKFLNKEKKRIQMSNITDKVVRIVLVFSMMLAIFQLPAHAQGKERPVKTLDFLSHDTGRWTL